MFSGLFCLVQGCQQAKLRHPWTPDWQDHPGHVENYANGFLLKDNWDYILGFLSVPLVEDLKVSRAFLHILWVGMGTETSILNDRQK